MKAKFLFLLFISSCIFPVQASEQEKEQNIITFSVQAEKEVMSDLIQVNLYVQEQGKQLKPLNEKVNNHLNQALTLLKQYPMIEIANNQRNTQIRYDDKQNPIGWIDRAEIRLFSKNLQALAEVLTQLQGKFAIGYIETTVSSETLNTMENELLDMVLTKFQHKAQLIRQTLNANQYKILELNITNPHENYAIPYARLAKVATDPENTDVNLVAGKTKLKVTIEAKIRLFID